MKNTTLLGVIVAIVLIIGGFMFVNGKAVTGSVIAEEPQALAGEIQSVTLGMRDFVYYPQEIRVKAGQEVEVTLDSSVKGCGRSFAIRDLGVSGYARTPNDKITFTPNKKGTFMATCSMGMVGPTKFIVE